MKFNISDPSTGGQKKIEIDNEKFIRPFYDRRMGQEVAGELMDDDAYKGYIFRITGGNDKQGFQMKQGILINTRTRILFKGRGSGYIPRRDGHRKRKSVRGCIVGSDIAAIFLRIVKKGEKDIEGVTNVDRANRLGPKRRGNIIKTFGLDKKKDDVSRYVVTREIKRGDKTIYKSPKIQRMISEKRLRRKHVIKKDTRSAWTNTKQASERYEKLLSQYAKEKKAAKAAAAKAAAAEKK
jgi:small subunit ribosomal protein S6e